MHCLAGSVVGATQRSGDLLTGMLEATGSVVDRCAQTAFSAARLVRRALDTLEAIGSVVAAVSGDLLIGMLEVIGSVVDRCAQTAFSAARLRRRALDTLTQRLDSVVYAVESSAARSRRPSSRYVSAITAMFDVSLRCLKFARMFEVLLFVFASESPFA